AYAKANPGKINLTSSGTGNLTHLSGELFRMMTGIDVVHVPYRGTPAAHSALMAGDVHAMFDAVGASVPHIQSGALRALGVTGKARLRVLPDVPVIGDVVPGYAVTGFLGIGVPQGTPGEIVERLNREVNAALAEPVVTARMAELGSEIFTGSPADFAKLIAEETEKWAKVVKFAGIKAGEWQSLADTGIFGPRRGTHFPVDSCNENLPEKCIHQNYARRPDGMPRRAFCCVDARAPAPGVFLVFGEKTGKYRRPHKRRGRLPAAARTVWLLYECATRRWCARRSRSGGRRRPPGPSRA